MVSVRVIAESNRRSGVRPKLAASSGGTSVAAHVTAGVGEIASTPGGLQTNSLVRFVNGKITIHAGDIVESSNRDPEEPHTITCTHAHPLGGRFNRGGRGAWYAAFEMPSAQAEVAFHRAVELKEIGWRAEEAAVEQSRV